MHFFSFAFFSSRPLFFYTMIVIFSNLFFFFAHPHPPPSSFSTNSPPPSYRGKVWQNRGRAISRTWGLFFPPRQPKLFFPCPWAFRFFFSRGLRPKNFRGWGLPKIFFWAPSTNWIAWLIGPIFFFRQKFSPNFFFARLTHRIASLVKIFDFPG